MKAFQRLLVAAPAAALLPVAMAPVSGLANDLNLDLDTVREYSVAQGASIRDFSDVYPTDWAYQALAELVDTYGCVAGYPDNTFRGGQPITRFEMAAILNSCMEAMSAKMGMMDDDIAMEDKETLEKLASSFEEELITLKGTVDGLDARVSELEENSQFSTTTKAEFKIATDFVYFSAEEEEARGTKMEKDGKEEYEKAPERTIPEQTIVGEDFEITIPSQTVMVTSAEVTVNPFTTVIGSQMIALPQQVVRDEIGPMTIGLKDSMFQNTNSADFAAGGKYSDFVTADTSKYMLIGVDDNNEIVVDDSSGILIDTDVATIAPTDNLVLVERPIDPATNARYTNGALTGTTDATTETAMTLLNLLNENRVMTEAVDAIIVNPSTVDIPMRTITIGDNMFDIMKQSDKAVNANNEVMIDEIMIPVSGSSTPVTISSNTVTIDSDLVNYPSISVNLMSGKATIGAREFTTGTGTYSISAIEITGNPEQIVVGEQTFIVEDEMVTVTDPMVTVEGLKYTVPDFTITEIDADGNATTNVATITGYTITENPSTMITEDNLMVSEVGPIGVDHYTVEVDGQTISIAAQTLTVQGQEVVIPVQTVPATTPDTIIPEQTIPAVMAEREVESPVPYGEDNSGLALSSSVEIAFETSFSGS
ncbi:MAG: iron uptake porin, partial [Gemmatimonadota bacterium]|nr:iron uptake porin [Gemmatimonadota bacterium]